MKPKRYAVSVSWGSGFHYFRNYFDFEKDAVPYAEALQKTQYSLRKSRGRRGAIPTVHVWKKL